MGERWNCIKIQHQFNNIIKYNVILYNTIVGKFLGTTQDLGS